MKVELVKIGNSRGIRIPKPLIAQCGLGDTVDLEVEDDRIVIRPHREVREGWSERFRAAAAQEEDEILMDGIGANEFDREEWEW